MKYLLPLIAAVSLSSCSSSPDLADKPDELRKLSPAAQVATILEFPIILLGAAAVCFACRDKD